MNLNSWNKQRDSVSITREKFKINDIKLVWNDQWTIDAFHFIKKNLAKCQIYTKWHQVPFKWHFNCSLINSLAKSPWQKCSPSRTIQTKQTKPILPFQPCCQSIASQKINKQTRTINIETQKMATPPICSKMFPQLTRAKLFIYIRLFVSLCFVLLFLNTITANDIPAHRSLTYPFLTSLIRNLEVKSHVYVRLVATVQRTRQ